MSVLCVGYGERQVFGVARYEPLVPDCRRGGLTLMAGYLSPGRLLRYTLRGSADFDQAEPGSVRADVTLGSTVLESTGWCVKAEAPLLWELSGESVCCDDGAIRSWLSFGYYRAGMPFFISRGTTGPIKFDVNVGHSLCFLWSSTDPSMCATCSYLVVEGL